MKIIKELVSRVILLEDDNVLKVVTIKNKVIYVVCKNGELEIKEKL